MASYFLETNMRTLSASVLLALYSFSATAEQSSTPPAQFDRYNVVWTSQSKDASESMPVGGHDIGLNVWVEEGDAKWRA